MKIEKISENKVKITLTIDELSQRHISIKDIEQDSNRAQDLFLDLLEESELNCDFVTDDSQLYVEASSDNENLFIVTITKIDYMPEISKYSSKKRYSPKKKKQHSNDDVTYTVASSIYKFSSLDRIFELCSKLAIEKAFMGTNSLYKYEDSYFIVFSPTSIKNAKFIKTFVILSEYAEQFYSSDMYRTLIKEKSELIIDKKAIQKIAKI